MRYGAQQDSGQLNGDNGSHVTSPGLKEVPLSSPTYGHLATRLRAGTLPPNAQAGPHVNAHPKGNESKADRRPQHLGVRDWASTDESGRSGRAHAYRTPAGLTMPAEATTSCGRLEDRFVRTYTSANTQAIRRKRTRPIPSTRRSDGINHRCRPSAFKSLLASAIACLRPG